jgi:hypothetical protein
MSDLPKRPVSWLMIERGWDVTAADGSQVGRVHETIGDENADIFDGLAVSTGTVGRSVYVPAEQVGEIVQGSVQLTIAADAVEQLDTYSAPPPTTAILPEASSFWDRLVGWFRGH